MDPPVYTECEPLAVILRMTSSKTLSGDLVKAQVVQQSKISDRRGVRVWHRCLV